jgi:hypothetical protein
MVVKEGCNRSLVIPQRGELVLGDPVLVPPPMVARWPEAACPPRNQESFANENALPRSLLTYKIDPFATRENGTLVRTTDGPMSWLER